LLLGLDRAAISRSLFAGRQQVADTFVNPLDAGYTDASALCLRRGPRPGDADEAGWRPGSDGVRRDGNGRLLSLELSTTAGNRSRELVEQVLQSQWRKIGVDIRIKNEPARVLFGETLRHRRIELRCMPGSARRKCTALDPAFERDPTEANAFAGQNAPGYNNPRWTAYRRSRNRARPRQAQRPVGRGATALRDRSAVAALYFRSDVFILPNG